MTWKATIQGTRTTPFGTQIDVMFASDTTNIMQSPIFTPTDDVLGWMQMQISRFEASDLHQDAVEPLVNKDFAVRLGKMQDVTSERPVIVAVPVEEVTPEIVVP